MTGAGRRWLRLALFLLLCLSAEFALVRLVVIELNVFPESDFAVYRAAALVGMHHGWAALYHPALIHAAVTGTVPTMRWQLFVNPPFVAWLALPFALAPYPIGYALWATAMTACMGLAFFLLTPASRRVRIVAGLVTLAFFPTVLTMTSGQVTGLVILLLALHWMLGRAGRDVWAGVVLAAAFALKPNVALLVPLAYVVAGRWRLMAAFAVTGAGLALITLVAIGTAGIVDWYRAEGLMQGEAINHIFTATDLMSSSWVRRLEVGGALLAAVAAWRSRGLRSAPLVIGLVATVVTAEHLNAHDLPVLLVAAAVQFTEQPRAATVFGIALAIAANSFVIMISWLVWNFPELWLLPLEVAWLIQLAVRPVPDAVPRTMPERLWRLLPLLAAAPVVALMLALYISKLFALSDLTLYLSWARIGLEHGWAHVYDPRHFAEAWRGLPSRVHFPNNEPPYLLWLVSPLTLLPSTVGIAVWQVVLLACTGWCWWVLSQPADRLPTLIVVIAFEYVGYGLGLGQVVPLLAGAVTACWVLDERGHPYLAGLVLSALVLKPQLGFLIPPALLLAGRYRVLAAWLVASGVLALAALLVVGPAGLLQLAANSQAGLSDFHRFDVAADLMLSAWVGFGIGLWIARAAVVALVLASAYRWRDHGAAVPLAAGLIGSILCTPFLHPQDLGPLLVAAGLCLRVAPAAARTRWRKLAYALIFLPLFPPSVPVAEVGWLGLLALEPARAWFRNLRAVSPLRLRAAAEA